MVVAFRTTLFTLALLELTQVKVSHNIQLRRKPNSLSVQAAISALAAPQATILSHHPATLPLALQDSAARPRTILFPLPLIPLAPVSTTPAALDVVLTA